MPHSGLDIEAEAAFGIALRLGIRCRCKQIADHVKHTGIGSRVRARGAPDGRLVDINDFIQLVHSDDLIVFSGYGSRTVQFFCKGLI